MGPAILLVGVVLALPLLSALRLSFERAGRFVGLDNYRSLIDDLVFREALGNNATLLLAVPVIVILAVPAAVLLHEQPRGWTLHRFVALLPFIIPIPVAAIAIAAIVSFRGGLNQALDTVGLGSLTTDWLGNPATALWVVMGALIWRELGFAVLLVLARLGTLDDALLEAAELDGAGWWQRVRRIILPELKGVLRLIVVLEVITVLVYTFEWVFVLTRGGPANSTMVVDLYIFQQAIQFGSEGIAAAAAILLLIALAIGFVGLAGAGNTLVRLGAWRDRARHDRTTRALAAAGQAAIADEIRPHRPTRQTRAGRVIRVISRQTYLWILAVLFVVPLYFIVVNAFKTKLAYASSPWSLPTEPTLDAFRTAFERGEMARWLRNSVVVTFGATALITVLAVHAAYYLSTVKTRLNATLRRLFVILIALPPIVILIPLFLIFNDLGLVNSYVGVIIVFAGILIPFSIFLLGEFFDSIPKELLESAAVDGAGRFQTLWRIVVPIAKPAIATQMIVNMLYVWNSLLIILIFLQSDEQKTLAAGIVVFQGRFFRDTPLVMAASLLITVPMLFAYGIAQRSFQRGLVAGSIK